MRIEISGITFSYNSRPVLDSISFAINEPNLVCLLGMNGAGKSTLLKCLNGILRPKVGSLLLEGKELFKMSSKDIAQRMGYVPQRYAGGELTVYEAILLGRKPHIRWSMGEKDHEVVEKVIEDLGLRTYAMRPLSTLSGGELQKVVIARALAQEPQILLLDEPTSNLDLKNQIEVMELIKEVIERHSVICIAALHDLNIAFRYGETFIFLKDHRVHSICSKQDIRPEILEEVYGIKMTLTMVNDNLVVFPEGSNG
jgi:iron complex transport system ATP-binding protein